MALLITFIILGLFIISQIYISMATSKSALQPYKVIHTEKEFEIRFYPVSTLATVTSSAKTYKELGSWGFRKLAEYIFGGNSSKINISMTAPVHMNINDTASTMSFVMPVEYNESNLPKPNDSTIKIETSKPEYVAVIEFGGFASNELIHKHIEILSTNLKKKIIISLGNYRFLGYNPPYQLFGRLNEVIVTVDWNTK